ncbi:MAG: 30S ribosomal protein S9 [Chloroflexi bacterium]|jgi:small subunit ribosomal protein S9|nr:30S ribosomal protein S9 [Chloroflexota bacterium]
MREAVRPPTRNYTPAVGRRKTAVARVRLQPGTGNIIVNGKLLPECFPRLAYQQTITAPLRITNTLGTYNVQVKVVGGGLTGQAEAIRHGIARALVAENEAFRPALRQAGFLTRDARVKERKKYGLKRARKAPQYTKR